MKIGVPTHPRRDPLCEIEWIAAHAFDFVDLFLEPDAADISRIDPVATREAIERTGLASVGHLAWYLPIGSPMRELRAAAVETAAAYLSVFSKIGVSLVTVHANWPPSLFSSAEGVAWQVESLQSIQRSAAEVGVGVMYEPLPTRQDTETNVQAVLDAVPGLWCHLDIGHCNTCGNTPESMIRRFGNRLRHVHVHDNMGSDDLHLPPGTGTVNWPSVITALRDVGYDDTMTLEVFSPDRDYVLLARQKLLAWLDA